LCGEEPGFTGLAEISEAVRGFSGEFQSIKVADPLRVFTRIALVKCSFCLM
jgi:hypothetical protein